MQPCRFLTLPACARLLYDRRATPYPINNDMYTTDDVQLARYRTKPTIILLGRIACTQCTRLVQSTDGVSWSVGVSVSWSGWSALQKRLNRSRCRLERADSGEPKEPRIRCESRSSIERGQFGWFFRPIQKYGKLLLRTQHQKINNGVSLRCTKWIIPSSITVCSERNHSVFSNSTTCDVRCALSSKFLAYYY